MIVHFRVGRCFVFNFTNKLTSKDQEMFSKIPVGIATLSAKELSKVLLEPHASWVEALEKEWKKRYNK